MKKKRPLNPQQLKFVQEYIILGNAKESARRAGYSEKWASRVGSRMIDNCRIQDEINKQCKKTLTARDITKEKVLAELAKIGFSEVSDLSDDEFEIKNKKDIKKNTLSAIQSIQIDEQYHKGKVVSTKKKFKLYDKKGALDTMLKYMTDAPDDEKNRRPIELKYRLGDSKKEKDEET